MFWLHTHDRSLPAGPDGGKHPNCRRAAYRTAGEALAQAAHDMAREGREIVRVLDGKGRDVLDRKKLAALAAKLEQKEV